MKLGAAMPWLIDVPDLCKAGTPCRWKDSLWHQLLVNPFYTLSPAGAPRPGSFRLSWAMPKRRAGTCA